MCMNAHRAFPILLCAFVSFLIAQIAHGQMSSTNYRIDWDAVNAGGDSSSSSSSYILRDTVGTAASGASTSSTYSLDAGFRGGVYDRVVDFSVFLQNRATQVAATALSGTTVTVTSASGFSVSDLIAIVQNEGASQSAAIGQITAIAGSNITVDALSGDSLSIDGSNDLVYRLDATSLSLGTLDSSFVSTSIVAWESTNDVDDGFSVYLFEDGDLSDGSDTIADVLDGTVTAGSSEYGARSSDTTISSSTFDTQDTAITSTPVAVGTDAATSIQVRQFLTLKVAIDDSQTSGTYSQTLTVLYVGDY